MDESNTVELPGRDVVTDPLTELLRKGAWQLLQTAIEAELETFLKAFKDHKTPDGLAGVVQNGHQPKSTVQAGVGPVTVKIPKVRSKVGKPVTFRSALVPPCFLCGWFPFCKSYLVFFIAEAVLCPMGWTPLRRHKCAKLVRCSPS